jgi:RNA polymerase sigma-70 factor, ECF subfamily
MSEAVDPQRMYHTHRAALRRRARRLTGSDHDAEDLVQATFERSLRKLASFQPGTRPDAWLTTIMNHLFVDGWRKQRRELTEVREIALPAPEPEEVPWWHQLTPEEVRVAAAELPAQLRELFEARHLQGASYAALADRMGTCTSTIGSRLSRTRRRLRAVLVKRHRRPEPRYPRRR